MIHDLLTIAEHRLLCEPPRNDVRERLWSLGDDDLRVKPFVPAIGMALIYGDWTIVVEELSFDLETKRLLIVDLDDRTLVQLHEFTTQGIVERTSLYIDGGWIVTRYVEIDRPS